MNKQQKNNIFWIVTFLLISIGLFVFQNFVMPAQQQAKRAVVYVASKDLSDETLIDIQAGDQFKTIQISEDSIIEGSVLDLSSVNGKVIEGGLLEGELLTTKRLTDETKESGDLFVKVEPDFPVDIRDGENVQVFVQGDFGEGYNEVKSLYKQKKVYSSSRVTNLIEGDSSQGYYLRMDEQELKDYYLSKARGAIILAKISPTAGDITKNMVLTNKPLDALVEKTVEENSVDVSEEGEITSSTDAAVRYEVKEGDTFESVAHSFEMPVEAIKAVNPSISELKAGEYISLPGQN